MHHTVHVFMLAGILAAMIEDIARGVVGVKRFLVGYRDDGEISQRGSEVVRSLESTSQRVAEFLANRKGSSGR